MSPTLQSTWDVPHKQKKCGQKTTVLHVSVVELEENVTSREIFRHVLVRTNTAHRRRSSKKKNPHRTRKNKSNRLEPHFQTSATKLRSLKDIFYSSTSLICTKRIRGREKAVRHVQDIYWGKRLVKVRHLRHTKGTWDIRPSSLSYSTKNSLAVGFTAHVLTRF